MPRKKKEETTEEVKTTKCSRKKAEASTTTTKCSKYGFTELQNNAKLKVKGLCAKVK